MAWTSWSSSPRADRLEALFKAFGFSKTCASGPIELYQQGDISFLVNREPIPSPPVRKVHGPNICSMGWRSKDAKRARAWLWSAEAEPF